jgi:hypothetical protein
MQRPADGDDPTGMKTLVFLSAAALGFVLAASRKPRRKATRSEEFKQFLAMISEPKSQYVN